MSVSLSELGKINFKGSEASVGTLSLIAPVIDADSTLSLGKDNVRANITTTPLTLTLSESSSVIPLTSAGADMIVNLPVCQAGLKYKFFLDVTAGTKSIVITPNAGKTDLCYGNYYSGVGPVTTPIIAGKVSITFTKTSTVGDMVEFVGTAANKWLVMAVSSVKDAITAP